MLDRTSNAAGAVGMGWSPVQVAPPMPRLNPRERAQAEQVARRLHAELRTVVGLLPEQSRGAQKVLSLHSVERTRDHA